MAEVTNSDKQEWSSTHARIRVELFLTGIVIFSIHYLGLRLGQTAPFFFQFRASPSVFWMSVALYPLFFYFFAAFCLKTASEGLTKSNFAKDLKTYTDELKSRTDGAVSAIGAPSSRIDSFAESLFSFLPRTQSGNQSIALISSAETLTSSLDRDITELQTFAEQYRELINDHRQVNDAYDQISTQMARLVPIWVEDLKRQGRLEREAREDQMQTIVSNLDDLRRKTKALIRDTSAWRIVLNAEKLWLNVFIPGTASVLLAASPLLRLWLPDLQFT